jgi:hypothetical protein
MASKDMASNDMASKDMASNIDPRSGMRLPLPSREDLDEAGKKAYDRGMTPGATIAGLQGPAGIQLYSPKTAAASSGLNRYLRFEAGFTPHVREVAILITAREMDSQFEWVAHEPEALKEGVPQKVIDVIKYRRSTDGLDETDALIIELGRGLAVRFNPTGRARHADGELCGNGGAAHRGRHAIACWKEAFAADSVTVR